MKKTTIILLALMFMISSVSLAAALADKPVSVDEDVFTVPNTIAAKGIEDFIGEWHIFRIVKEDGTDMNREEILAEGYADDQAKIIITKDEIVLYAKSLNGSESLKHEFVSDDGSLRILNGSDALPILRMTDNSMLMIFMPAYNMSSGDMTVYLIREEL